jgi:hypothetical protein
MEWIEYGGWPRCVRLANERVELVVTTDVGPRIIRLGFRGGENEFAEMADQLGKTGGEEWRIYGGHRLWHGPEAAPRSYHPDNLPVRAEGDGQFLRVIEDPEPRTGIQKEIEIRLHPTEARVQVRHRLRNTGLWAVRFAPWALSVMAPGGRAVVPEPRPARRDTLLPNRVLVLWPYADLSDPRLGWGTRYLFLRQDPEATAPVKFGHSGADGWGAYVRGDHLFMKTFPYHTGAEYPDFGSAIECYTNRDFLELESLGPLRLVEPGAAVEHEERWLLATGASAASEDDVERTVLPRVAECRAEG